MTTRPDPRLRLVAPDALETWAAAVFAAAGLSQDDARLWAQTLVWANLRGADSHGVMRIPRYLHLLDKGEINPRPAMTLIRAAGAIALLDADRAPGPVAMTRAMDEAIERARQVHVGWCVARSITHAGAVGRFALKAAEAGMVGLVMTASTPMMAYEGSRGAVVSSNPIAIAVPAATHAPLLLDMATATVALGKIMNARKARTPIPLGWGLDAEGLATTDAAQAVTLTPMAGPKGSGLSLMIECLASLAAGNPVLAPALAGAGGTNLNGLVIAVDIAAICDPAEFGAEVDLLAQAVAAQPRAKGVERLYPPGERGDAILAKRRREGVPLPEGVWRELAEAALRTGAPPPPAAGPGPDAP